MKIKWFVSESPIRRELEDLPDEIARRTLELLNPGWGNGYVCLPPEHPCYGMSYRAIYKDYGAVEFDVELTFSNFVSRDTFPQLPPGCEIYWIVGFDTAHAWDSMARWPKIKVEEAARGLAENFEGIRVERQRKPDHPEERQPE
ncbi:MAG: hypothetical protein WKF87_21140 [Chryseolinea sp.]